jgi:hypothetical protein
MLLVFPVERNTAQCLLGGGHGLGRFVLVAELVKTDTA